MAADMCKVAAVLGGKVEDDFRKWYIDQQLAEYHVLYSESEDVAWLDKIDQRQAYDLLLIHELFRYRWFVNKLADFERTGTAKIFPASWEIGRTLAMEFCVSTRLNFLIIYDSKFRINFTIKTI